MNRFRLMLRLTACGRRWRRAAVWAALLSTSAAANVHAQSGPEQVFSQAAAADAFTLEGDPSGSVSANPSWGMDAGVGGMGVLGRVGHIAGETVGRTQSITHFELMPYLFDQELMVFGDGRFYVTNNGRLGGSGGAGVRYFLMDYNAVLGGSVFYDRDNTRTSSFDQIGASFEVLSEWLDIRTNLYQTVGQDQAVLGTSFISGSEHFVDDNIAFNTQTRLAAAADGIDMLFTVPVPGAAAQAANLEISAGWYIFEARGKNLPNATGWRLRADADWFAQLLHTFIDFTSDDVFEHNIVFGADVNYMHDLQRRPRVGQSQYNRMAEWVRRNYNVVTIDDTVRNPDELAINPRTGLPYVVLHVRNAVPASTVYPNFPAPAGTGAIDSPYQFITEAQADPRNADIIYVHNGSVFENTPVVLEANQQILGEGVIHPITVANTIVDNLRCRPIDPLGTICMPEATPDFDANGDGDFDDIGDDDNDIIPQLRNSLTTAVTLANNSTFAGFDIIDSRATAVFANGVVGSTVRSVRVQDVSGGASHGVHLVDIAGTWRFEDTSIDIALDDLADSAGEGLFIDGGDAILNWFGGTITNTGFTDGGDPPTILNANHAVLIQNQDGGVINLAGDSAVTAATGFGGVTITDTLGSGVLIQDTKADIVFGRSVNTPANEHGVRVTGSDSAGFRIVNLMDPGSVSILRGLSINNAAQEALDIDSITGDVQILDDPNVTSDLLIRNRNDVGIDLTNIDNPGSVVINGDTDLGAVFLLGTQEPAINFQDGSTGLVRFGGDILIGDPNPGVGDPNLASVNAAINIGGALPNSPGAVFEANGNVTIIDSFNGPSISVTNDPSTVRFGRTASTSVVNIQPIFGEAILLQNNSGVIQFNSQVIVDNSFSTTIDINNNSGQISFGTVNVTSSLGLLGGPAAVSVLNNRNADGTASVAFNSLNVNSIVGLALQAVDNDNFRTSSGILATDSGAVLDLVDNDVLSAVFTSVSADDFSDLPFAMRVIDTRLTPNPDATFIIRGTGALGSGGLISNLTVGNFAPKGALIQNINTVEINQQDYLDVAGIGIDVLNAAQFTLRNSRMQNIGLDDPDGIHHIRLLADHLRELPQRYEYELLGNLLSDDPGQAAIVTDDAMVHIEGLTNAESSLLELLVRDNQDVVNVIPGFFVNRQIDDGAAVRVDWNGPLDANFFRNTVEFSADSTDAFAYDITQRGATFAGLNFQNQVNFEANVVRSPGIGSFNITGARMRFDGPTNLSILENSIVDPNTGAILPAFQFFGALATGFDLSFRSTGNNIVFDDNTLDFNAGGGTGLVFTLINSSNVRIGDNTGGFTNYGNVIELADTNLFVDRGIIFQTTFGTINLFGNQDNIVRLNPNNGGVLIDFQQPANSTGTILINGVARP